MSRHSDAVQGLSDKDARAFLLDALDRRTSKYNERKCRVLTYLGKPKIPATPLALLILLWDRRDGVVSHDELCTVMEFEADFCCDYWATPFLLSSQLKRLRKVAKAHGWPIKIIPYYRIGYSLDVTDPGWRIEQ